MSRTAETRLKSAEAIALNAQGKGYTNELGSASSNGLHSIRLKQRSSLNLKLQDASSSTYAELIQDRNGNARIDRKEVLGRSRLKNGTHSLKADHLNQGTYFLRVNTSPDQPMYQLVLSTASQSSRATASMQPPQHNSQPSRQLLQSNSRQNGASLSQSGLGDFLSSLLSSSRRWKASFINRTASNVSDYGSYNFSRPALEKDLGSRGNSGKRLARLKLNHGSGSPGSGVQDDNFAMQAWTRVSLKAGKFYQIKSSSNDGTRFFFRDRKTGKIAASLDGDWRDSGGTWTQLLTAPEGGGGSFDFYVQSYERTGTSAIDIVLEEVQPTGKVTASTLNLRSNPSTLNNTPIASLSSGTDLKILRKVQSTNDTAVPDWYQVTTADGKQGYVAAQSNLVQLSGNSNSIVNVGNGTQTSGGGIQAPGNGNGNSPRPTGGSGSSDGRTSQKGVDLIKSFEGLSLSAYRDPVGVWTIGYGTTSGIKSGMRISQSQAESYLKQDLARFENAVKSNVKVSLNSDQFSALVSFAYNVGEGALASSTLLRMLNQSDYQGAADQLLRWNKGDGVELAGLTRRRKAERAMFLGQDYTAFL